MALRKMRYRDDEVLYKKCKEVKNFDKKLEILLDDMYETMQKSNGVGLAAPQVGILKRVVVIDIGEGRIELINPEIIEKSGSQTGNEGCLSFPGVWGEVERPMYVKVKASDRNGKEFVIEGEELLARAICHECDHLDGVVFTSHVIKFVDLDED
ncbi:MAG: peptide deformylase [Clostridia bacterium]|nr:peptide deformylase [Clostridia bacterium]MEE0411016.1 peptide deformylase [Clostridia bacterium]